MRKIGAQLLSALVVSSTVAWGQVVEFDLDDTLDLRGTEIAYGLKLELSAIGPARVRIDALLDLRDFQERLPSMLTGDVLVDLCRNETILEGLSVAVDGRVVRITGEVVSRFFECSQGIGADRERGAQRNALDLVFLAEATTVVRENCFVFDLIDLRLQPAPLGASQPAVSESMEAARTLALEAARLVLQESPFCPDLPPELASLDPIYESGGPREIDDGGLGVYMRGSIDVSTTTIINILHVLQAEGVIPGSP